MNQYTIQGFSGILLNSIQFERQKTREKKLLLLDRCNWFISAIVKANLKLDKPYNNFANLNSKTLKKNIGDRNYKDIEMCLIGLGIIIENKKYSSKKFSKSFALTPKAIKLGVQKTKVHSKKFINKQISIKKEEFENTSSEPILKKILKKILDNTARLMVVEESLYYVERILPDPEYIFTEEGERVSVYPETNNTRMDRYDTFYESFKALNEITDTRELINSIVYYTPSKARSGRIYHTIAHMPKLIRESLRTKSNELIWEVDMTSAQPSIIFLEWLNDVKESNCVGISKEYNLCLDLLLNGGIYKYVQDNSEYFKNLEYKKLKQSILSVINAENIPTEQNIEMSKLFPSVMSWLNEKKKKLGYKEISYLGQKAEANIFVEVYKNIPDEQFALIIHDCILTTKDYVEIVKSQLEKRVRILYNNVITSEHSLDKLFKAEIVSITDEMLLKNQSEAYFKEVYENRMNN